MAPRELFNQNTALLDRFEVLAASNKINAVVAKMRHTECFGNFTANIAADPACAVNTDAFDFREMFIHRLLAFYYYLNSADGFFHKTDGEGQMREFC